MRQQPMTDGQNAELFTAPPQDIPQARGARRSPVVSRAMRSQPSLLERISVALRATHLLAFPHQPVPSALSVGDDEAERRARAAEEQLLRATLAVLHALALPRVAAVFVPTGEAAWRELPLDADAQATLLADPRWPEFADSEPITCTATQHPELWEQLTPWRQQSASRQEIARVTLIPVHIADELRAICALAQGGATGHEVGWLPVAAAVATAGAAGIRALRLELWAQAEARARDAYISLAVHELRSPLTSIKGYAQLLLRQARKSPLPETMQRSVESIEQQSLRMAEMVGEVLDASRIRRGVLELLPPAPTDLVTLALKVAGRRAVFYSQDNITVEAAEPSLVGMWDTARIEQVLRDLVHNAARHSPRGGPISVHIWREEGMALVSVRDRGIGVAKEDHERIFDYLYRAPRSEERNLSGLGLGLFVSRHIIERHGGQLVLYETSTTEPSGSEFRFTLPLS